MNRFFQFFIRVVPFCHDFVVWVWLGNAQGQGLVVFWGGVKGSPPLVPPGQSCPQGGAEEQYRGAHKRRADRIVGEADPRGPKEPFHHRDRPFSVVVVGVPSV